MDIDPAAPACRAYAQHLAGLRQGVSRFKAPDKMRVGEVRPVAVVIGDVADSAAIEAELPAGNGQTGNFATKVGTEMGAELIASPGLSVAPAGIVRKQLLPTGPTRWDWQVTAKTRGRGELDLKTYVFLKLPDGTLASHALAQSAPQYIAVDVAPAARAHEIAGGVSTGLGDLTGILKGVGGVLAAALAAWLGFRKFGGGKGTAPPAP